MRVDVRAVGSAFRFLRVGRYPEVELHANDMASLRPVDQDGDPLSSMLHAVSPFAPLVPWDV